MFKKRTQPPEPRRSRYRTEQQKSTTFSYYASRDASDSVRKQRLRTDEERRASVARSADSRFRMLSYILVPVAIITLLLMNSYLDSSVKVQIEGDSASRLLLRDAATYQKAADKAMAASVLNHSKLTVDTAKVEQVLTGQFPELASVNVVLPLVGNQAQVHLLPAQPIAVLVAGNGKSYMLDQEGRLISSNIGRAPKGTPTILDQTGYAREASIGDKVLPSDDVHFIQIILHQLTAKKVAVQSLTLPASASRDLDVRLVKQPFFIKFSLSDNPLQQAGTYLALQQKLDAEHMSPKQYIDVRVAGKAYYK